MKLSLPMMPAASASGAIAGGDEAGTLLGGVLGGGNDATLRPMDEALAFASLLLQAGDGSGGTPLPVVGGVGGKALPPAAEETDAAAIATAPATVDHEELEALVSLLVSPGVGAVASEAPPAPAAVAVPRAPLPLAVRDDAPSLRGSRLAGARGLDNFAEIQGRAADAGALPEAMERKGAPRPTADTFALLRGAEPPAAGGAEPGARVTGDVRGLGAALVNAGSALPTGADAGTVSGDRALVSVRAPLGGDQWSESFAERVGWVVNKRLGSAEVRLNPAHLGPIEVSINVDDEQARVVFSAPHAATREAIEQAMPRLRELLAQQGLDLRQADVGGFTAGDRQGARSGDSADPGGDPGAGSAANGDVDGTGDGESPLNQSRQQPLSGSGLIDTFV